MKKIILKSISIIGLFFVFTLSTCNQEEVQPREFPRIQTLEVTEIDSEGATFNAKIVSQGNQEISEYGFVWGHSEQIDIDQGEWKTIKGSPASNVFNIRVSATLEKNKRYYVKAYTKTKDYKTYGSVPSFVSLGSEAPIIESFSPSNANIGDTIYVLGKNFSNLENTTQAFIGGIKSRVLSTNYDTIQIIVPDTITAKDSEISISVAGNISKASSLFTINSPVIEYFSPNVAIKNTLITITGKNFGYSNIFVMFDNIKAIPTSVEKDKIRVLFPSIPDDPKLYTLKVICFGDTIVANQKIYDNSLYISDFNPKHGSWLSEITLDVKNLNINLPIAVSTYNYTANIISLTDSSIRFTFPKIENARLTNFKLTNGDQSFITTSDFLRDTTKITAIEPSSGTVGDIIKITGENFHPILNYNKVFFYNSLQPFTLIDGNKNELIFEVSPYYNIPKSTITNRILNSNYVSPEQFEFTTPILESIQPTTFGYGTIVEIKGKNFSKVSGGNSIILDNYGYSVNLLSVSDTSIKFKVDRSTGQAESELKIKTGPVYSENSQTVKFVWNRISSVFNRNYPAAFMIGDELYYGFGNDMGGNYNQLYKINLNTNLRTYLTYIKGGIYEFGVGGIAFANNSFGFHGLGRKYDSNTGTYLYSQKLFRYTPASYDWEHYTSSPYPETFLQSFFQLGQYTYIGLGEGEYGKTKEFWKYHPDNNIWEEIASLPGENRNDAVSISDGSYGYVGFGKNESGELLNDFYKYDPSTNNWTMLNTSGLPNMAGYTTVYNDPYIYLAGGENDADKYAVFRYNTTTDSWEELSNFVTSNTDRGLGYIKDDTIYIFSRGLFYRYNQENENSIIPLK